MPDTLTLAISKGRILDESLPLLQRAGIRPEADPRRSRSLVLATDRAELRLMVIRAQDVPTFVEYGAADAGIAGKDVLLEYGGDLYEPLDLGIARCRMVVAGRAEDAQPRRRLRVATKYVSTARRHFAERGLQVEIIRLYGSIELAPLVGLAHRIVDLVDTGSTLRANGLVVLEEVAPISARLIVNRASMKMKHARVHALMDELARATQAPSLRTRPAS
ncbi:MAG: ATP phosphoribosyltransferase [Gammaproteobacteria bacterium]|nr:ATP phosphoribosyltransferase [Gammaproteobacteria bacterium]NIR82287.1 ATP phosphoribosyltransferase [Gammaproteobacteria bacterium]NIR91218.1 ATP phosphoribosyltransferase [Gammaproteobacteria bacterium]NIU03436.1 ATP phosphoribosyltransferase [Gammaproteobacteria bacterium]NIX84711.1 ATP phosphoribosyltransferase [Gammaproteobacteria bacterium]